MVRVEHDGIAFTKEELEDFQRVFPMSPAARLLDKMVVALAENWRAQLTSCGSTMDGVRQAQGAVTVLDSLMNEAVVFAGLQVDWEQEESDETESDETGMAEGVDVGY